MGLAKTIYAKLFVQGREHLGATLDPALSERDACGILRRALANRLRGLCWTPRMGFVKGRLFVGRRVSVLSPGHIRCGQNVKFEDLAEDQEVDVLGRDEAGEWLKLSLDSGEEGWVAAEFIDVGVDVETLPIEVP